MEKDIQHIQNEIWRLYKGFVSGGSMEEYNRGVQAVVREYVGNRLLLNFCQDLVISWAPIMNTLSDLREKRNGQHGAGGIPADAVAAVEGK